MWDLKFLRKKIELTFAADLRTKTFYSLLLLIAAMQCLYVGAIVYEHSHRLEVWLFVLLFCFLIASFFQSRKKPYTVDFDSWRVAIWVFFGSLGTWWLREQGMGVVMAAATMGLIGSLFTLIPRAKSYFRQISAPVYCGAFIGMTSVQSDPVFLLLASTFTLVLFVMGRSLIQGVGGKLGTLAFIGVVLAYGVHYSFQWI